MKKLLLILFFVLCAHEFVSAQSNALDGKSFTIIMYINKERDSVDTLHFENATAYVSSGKQYGFAPITYKAKEKNGTISFEFYSVSIKNGIMIWACIVTDDKVEGTLIWDKELVNPVNYTFKTKEEYK
ncbi:MAG: hypothetical protein LH473_05420 [Chitinophagales bacterium]|nr:hypothetical protein [Chitinophagales bacterium]